MQHRQIKLGYVEGLQDIVLEEISGISDFSEIEPGNVATYAMYTGTLAGLLKLRSVARAYLVARDARYNPGYISRHKAILGDLIENILEIKNQAFKSFSITAAGNESPEVRSIASYIEDTFNLGESDDPDMKIHIIKNDDVWEAGVQITTRPLSVRSYKTDNMSGAMDPTIAYALNHLCDIQNATSYMNAFCGSGTLLTEAALVNTSLSPVIGFDNNKAALSKAIHNIRQADLIRRIQVQEADILEGPDLGTFDVITADLPFGMTIAKGEDLPSLYKSFIEFAARSIAPDGRVGIFTPKTEIIEGVIMNSPFKIIQRVPLLIVTSVDAYMYPVLYVCELK